MAVEEVPGNDDGAIARFECALKFPLHPISLILIYFYLIMNTFYEGFADNNLRGAECTCKPNDQGFYQFLYWFSCAVWWTSVIATYSFHIG